MPKDDKHLKTLKSSVYSVVFWTIVRQFCSCGDFSALERTGVVVIPRIKFH